MRGPAELPTAPSAAPILGRAAAAEVPLTRPGPLPTELGGTAAGMPYRSALQEADAALH